MTTPIDPRAEAPEQPKTAQLAAVPQWAIELTQAMKSGIAEVRADVALVSNDLGLLKTRVSIMEGLRTEDDMRASKYSGGIKSLSTSNAEQDAQLAQERAAREDLAKQVAALATSNATQLAILSRLDKVAANPTVKLILFALGTIATGYLASKGLGK